MTGHGTIFNGGWPLTDRYGVGDPTVVSSLLRVVARATHDPCLAPDRVPAHDWLARLYKLIEGGIEKAAMHQALAMTARDNQVA